MLDVGRLCIKTAGREAGRYCVIIKKVDKSFVMITGPRPVINVRRRKCNIEHIEPLDIKIKISPDASDSEVINTYKKEGLYAKLRIKPMTKEEIKKAAALKAEKLVKKKAVEKEKEKELAKKEKTEKKKPKKPKAKPKPKEKKHEKKPKAKKVKPVKGAKK